MRVIHNFHVTVNSHLERNHKDKIFIPLTLFSFNLVQSFTFELIEKVPLEVIEVVKLLYSDPGFEGLLLRNIMELLWRYYIFYTLYQVTS